MSARHRAYLMLLGVALIWGLASPIIKFSLPHFPPLLYLSYRFLISIVIMVPLLFHLEPRTAALLSRLTPATWFWLILAGFLGSTVQLTLLFMGLDLTTAIDGAVINATSPVFVAIAGYFFLREHLSKNEVIGLLTAAAGTFIITIQPLLEGQSLLSGSLQGNLLVLSGTFAWVFYVILTKKQLKHNITPLFLTTNMFIIGFIAESILLFYRMPSVEIIDHLTSAPLSAHLSIFYMAVFSGTIAYYLYQKAQKLIEVSEANIFLYLSPVFSVPISHLWLGEQITLPFIIGSLIILAGITISEIYPRRHTKTS